MPNLIDHSLLCPKCMHKSATFQRVCPNCKTDRETVANTVEQLPVGAVLNDKYYVGAALGQGGFGITYIVYDMTLDVKMALKEYYPSNCVSRQGAGQNAVAPYSGDAENFFHRGREQFMEEARSLARFSDLEGVVGVRDFFMENNTAYIVMDFAEGSSLKHAMEEKRRGNFSDMLEMMRPLISDLRVIHDSNLIHRDIKPDNIMVSPDNKAVLIDFGAARAYMGNQRFSTYSVSVTHGYAPVEQYQNGSQGPWTDVYAMCATLYELATGKQPASALERLLNQLPLPKPSEIGVHMPKHVEDAIMAGLILQPEQRTQSMHALYDALYAAPAAAPAKASKGKEKKAPKEKGGRRGGVPGWVACLMALVMLAVGGLYVMDKLPEKEAAPAEKTGVLVQAAQARPWVDGALDFGGSAELESALREACSLPEGDLLPMHAQRATELILDGIPLSNTEFLRQFTSLHTLSLRETGVTDLSFLEGMTGLTKLDVSGNRVTDLAPISALTELTYLWMANNRVADLAPISGLTNLEVLDVSGNQVEDLSALSGLTRLRRLWVQDNRIATLKPLGSLGELVMLSAGRNQLTDIAGLTNLAKLEYLYLYGNEELDVQAAIDVLKGKLPLLRIAE